MLAEYCWQEKHTVMFHIARRPLSKHWSTFRRFAETTWPTELFSSLWLDPASSYHAAMSLVTPPPPIPSQSCVASPQTDRGGRRGGGTIGQLTVPFQAIQTKLNHCGPLLTGRFINVLQASVCPSVTSYCRGGGVHTPTPAPPLLPHPPSYPQVIGQYQ